MRAVVQRVSRACVRVGGEVVGAIDRGILVYVAVGRGDDADTAKGLARRIARLRLFEGERRGMERSLEEVGGFALVVSEFTLYAEAGRGRRPNLARAAPAGEAEGVYDAFVEALRSFVPVETGRFGTHMEVESVNDGPVTFLLTAESGSDGI